MARTSLNAGLKHVSGRIDGWVYKQYDYGTVITRQPDMSRVKPSAKQLAHRENIRRAGEFHRKAVLANPALLARFTAIARRKGIPLSAVSLSEYLKTVRRQPRSAAAAVWPADAVRPRSVVASAPEPQLQRFMAEHPALREAYEKLSKQELVQMLMRAEMRASAPGRTKSRQRS